MRSLQCTCKPTPYYLRFFQRTKNLTKKFEEATWCNTVSIGTLEFNHKYLIISAKSITTKLGPNVLLTMRDSHEDPAQIFLPK